MRELSIRRALNEALRQALQKNPGVIVFGEDVGLIGGSYGVTAGLMEEFGEERVFDSPIAELVLPGIGLGAAILGLKPIVEFELIDFITIGMDGIINALAKTHYMSGGNVKASVVIRAPQGAFGGGSATHSQSFHALFMGIPGLKIATPSTPFDAKGLLLAAIEDDNPVLFIEDRGIYREKGDVPEEYYKIPFGKATIRRTGSDVTIVATMRMVAKAIKVAENYAKQGIEIEVIDPRTLCPLDKETIINSVKKTGRLITVDEGCLSNSFGSEIAAIVAEEAIDYLRAPVKRVAAPMVPIPYNLELENLYVPGETQIRDAIKQVIEHI
jgi:acetoin:2,6-dichlorophenolindophenol oxidoreductase subunit beta